MKISSGWQLLQATFKAWHDDKVPLWAAALAYYTAFSLAPLLVIAIAIAGAFFGADAARGEVVGQIRGLVGQQGAEAIQAMLQNTQQPGSGGIVATVVGIGALLLGASGVFGQLQDAMNAIWGVAPKPGRGIRFMLQNRFLSFAMVLVIGFLLLVSLVLSAGLAAFGSLLGQLFPTLVILSQVINFMISFAVMTVLFALIYKVMPDVKIPWRFLWTGAIATALLFNMGKFLIGLYLGSGSVSSTYSAAASLGIILLWVYYSAQILLLGAEFTKVYAQRYGAHRIQPIGDAVFVNKSTSIP